MFSSSTNNKAVLLRGIELLASNAPDSERQLLELLRNSKDVLRQDYSSLRNYVPPPHDSGPTPSQHSNNPRQVSAPQSVVATRNGLTVPPRPRPSVEQPLPPKAKMMKGNPVPSRNPSEPVMLRPSKSVAPPSAPVNNQHQQQIPRPAYKQQLPPQQSSSQQSQQQHQPQPSKTTTTTKRERYEDDYYTDQNYKEPPDAGSSEDEREDPFPVKKRRPRAVVY